MSGTTWRTASRHALLGCAVALLRSTIALLLPIIITSHSGVLTRLWRLARLLRWLLSVAVVALCGPRGASRKAWESVAIEHIACFSAG